MSKKIKPKRRLDMSDFINVECRETETHEYPLGFIKKTIAGATSAGEPYILIKHSNNRDSPLATFLSGIFPDVTEEYVYDPEGNLTKKVISPMYSDPKISFYPNNSSKRII